MNLSDLAKSPYNPVRTELEIRVFDGDDGIVRVVANRLGFNAQLLNEIQNLTNGNRPDVSVEEAQRVVAQAIVDCVIEWDFRDENGVIPLNVDTLADIKLETLFVAFYLILTAWKASPFGKTNSTPSGPTSNTGTRTRTPAKSRTSPQKK